MMCRTVIYVTGEPSIVVPDTVPTTAFPRSLSILAVKAITTLPAEESYVDETLLLKYSRRTGETNTSSRRFHPQLL